jgi:predicted amidohydrolase
MIRVFLIPLDLSFRKPEENLLKMDQKLSEIRSPKEETQGTSVSASLCIFPELTLHGFAIREPNEIALDRTDSPISEIKNLAKKYHTAIIAGWIEKNCNHKPKNALGFFGEDGSILGVYHKIHLFNRGTPSEADTFAKGDHPLVIKWQGLKWGLSICYDLRFPNLYREYRLQNVDALVCSACWVGGPHKALQFKTLSQAHAIFNRSYFFAVNRSGKDPYYEYEGETHAFDPFGEPCNGIIDTKTIESARIYPLIESI